MTLIDLPAYRTLPDGKIDPLAHVGLARTIARRFTVHGMDAADVEQEAMLALLRAAEGYKPEAGAWSPYAYRVIWSVLCGVAYRHHRQGKFGSTRLHHKVRKIANDLYRRSFVTPSVKELRDVLVEHGIELSDYEVGLALAIVQRGEAQLDAPVRTREPGQTTTLGDRLASPDDVADEAARRLDLPPMLAAVKEMASGYRDTWAAVLWERILAEEPLTLEELGGRFGRTRERMRQIDVLVRRDLAALRPRFEEAPEEEEAEERAA